MTETRGTGTNILTKEKLFYFHGPCGLNFCFCSEIVYPEPLIQLHQLTDIFVEFEKKEREREREKEASKLVKMSCMVFRPFTLLITALLKDNLHTNKFSVFKIHILSSTAITTL